MPLDASGHLIQRSLYLNVVSLECAHSMRRLLLAFLLLFMPLQFIWAAASPYCGHEESPQVSHFGHHVHEHQAGHADEGAATSQTGETLDHNALAASGAMDVDCHACHGSGSGVAMSAGTQPVMVPVGRPAAQMAPAWAHPPLSRPERPNWSVLA